MPGRHVDAAVGRLERALNTSGRMAAHARLLDPMAPRAAAPWRHDSLVELALLRAYRAWEAFLEESFLLFMVGGSPGRRRAPKRLVVPASRVTARLLALQGRNYPEWGEDKTLKLAKVFFRGGEPYEGALRTRANRLADIRSVRNEIAHGSPESRSRFLAVARKELKGVVPARLTPGGFLDTSMPSVSPPQAFLEGYLELLRAAAKEIAG